MLHLASLDGLAILGVGDCQIGCNGEGRRMCSTDGN